MGCNNCNCQSDSNDLTNLNDEKLQDLIKFMEPLKLKEYSKSHLIEILHKIQGLYGYLDKEVLKVVSKEMNIPFTVIWGVATFYHHFNLAPVGKNIISVCLGTACYVKGADKVLDKIKEELNIEVGETTSDGLFSIHKIRCIGACGIAPVMTIGDKVYGEVKPDQIVAILSSYKNS